ncbi:ribosome biogenesis protein WDR12 homolog [Anopheles aquasalis]|uniref:ribosome biogenesis protein WDR12 homolog n=1 Tax=Anopheles aquasalis TaxID=42839 RepID=UPI00215B4C16|nr:ribosome biogenesis protein WDR12 homolog [Anopheles aquasalis]
MSLRITNPSEGQLQVHLTTKQKQFAVPDVPYSIRANVSNKELNVLVNTLLKDSGNAVAGNVEFDFLLNGEFVKIPLGQHLKEREISFEDTIDLEYVERYPAPEPQDCLLHDDWVSAVQAKDGWILTASYDNTVNLWNTKGKHKLTIPGHMAPVKGVAWVSLNENTGVFASASHDQNVMLWEWNVTANKAECVAVCKGHERGVGCIAVNPSRTQMASGSMDMMLKIWSTDVRSGNGEPGEEPSANKKAKLEEDNVRTPKLTLAGHREFVSGVQWIDDSTIATSSWDHTIKLWDLSLSGIKSEITGNKSFFDLSYSPLNGMIITASPDKNLRLYDLRSKHGTIVKNTYLGHTQWVQSVRWSTTNEFLFVSGAYDNHVKLWDHRSPKAPIYELIGHEDKVLAVDWSNPKYILSGGSDNAVRVFKSKIAVQNSNED